MRIIAPLKDLFQGQLAEERPRFVNWVPVIFGAGIWAYFALKAEPGHPAAILPLAMGLVAIALSSEGDGRRLLAVMLVIAGLGFLTAKIRTAAVAAPVLDRTLRAAELTGVLERREPHAKRGERLTLRLTSIAGVAPQTMPRRARIRILGPAGDVKPGDRLRLTATLSPPAAPALPGGYDFARAAFFEQIGAVGYALKRPEKLIEDGPEPPPALRLRAAVEEVRQDIGRRIQSALPGERGALAAALITGERGGISQETTDAYRDSGLVHILSISGLHMAIMAGAVFATIRFLLAAIPILALTQPIKKWAAAAGAAGAILYYTISGGSAATLRSAIMMVVFFLAVMLGRPAIAMRNVAIAALVILALFPESLLDAGFQMSFAAVAALVAAYEASRRLVARRNLTPGSMMRGVLFLGGILFSTVIAGLAVTPLSVYHFHAMQHYAPLANLAAVPICNLVVMPAALATLAALPFGLEAAPLWIMGWGLDAMGMVARYVAGLPGAVTRIAQVPDMAFALILAGGLWLVLWQQRWRLAGIVLILAGFAASPDVERPDLLVGREGALVAVRDASGRLAAHSDRPSTFELARWLEHDGDGRDPKAVRKTAAFRCDPLGCSTSTAGDPLAVSRHPASIADDCDRAKILIVNGARPRACDAPHLVLDRAALQMSGTVALYRRADGTYDRRSVAEARGERPWSSPHRHRKVERSPASTPPREGENPPAGRSAAPPGNDRIAAPASAIETSEDMEEIRPDVDEDDSGL
ncbi:MAG: ComEC family competence protein [Hyphomicrobium sp.]|nr:ComEC family competence protein [Hyphomicrobium sp.]